MLPSPLSVTIGTETYAMSKINQDNFGSRYLAKGENVEVTLEVKHVYEKASTDGQYERHNFDLRRIRYDPTGAKAPQHDQVYTVMRCKRGSLSADLVALAGAQSALLELQRLAVISWES